MVIKTMSGPGKVIINNQGQFKLIKNLIDNKEKNKKFYKNPKSKT